MRTGRAVARERITRRFERNALAAAAAGLSRVRVEDEQHDGGHVVIDGRKVLNMGSCAYMGLNVDQRLKQGAIEAIERFGPVFSSSTAYTSVPLYTRLEQQLEEIMGCRVLVPTTTTLGHFAFLQVAPESGDVLIVDAQAHASLHLAAHLPQAQGIGIWAVPHNDPSELEEAILRAEADGAGRIWYVADGVYSMYGDTFLSGELLSLLDAHPSLHVYIDDAHGFSWFGYHGCGLVRDGVGLHPRVIIAASLSKSFGSGGAALAIPDEDLADRIQVASGTMTFSGPLHPAELGAATVSAEIHLSDEGADRQAELMCQIRLMRQLLAGARVPVADTSLTPIWYVPVGPAQAAIDLGRKLLDAEIYTNVALFPAVPHGMAGLRFTQTLYHSDADLMRFADTLGELLPEVLSDRNVVDLR